MCRFDDCDGAVTPINLGEFRTAKKIHRCNECYRQIDIGESYHYETFKFDGDFTQHKTCAHCYEVRKWLLDECSGWVYGQISDDLEEHRGYGYGEGSQFDRIVVSMKNKWRRRDGTVRPLPNMPESAHK